MGMGNDQLEWEGMGILILFSHTSSGEVHIEFEKAEVLLLLRMLYSFSTSYSTTHFFLRTLLLRGNKRDRLETSTHS